MRSSDASSARVESRPIVADRFARLRATPALRDGAHARWRASTILLAGGGLVGAPIAREAVRSGACVLAVDPQDGAPENLGTQEVRPGVPKVRTLVESCDAIEPGRARGLALDVRRVGAGTLRGCDLLVDATDDPDLALPLTEVSNGLGIPLLRAAVDGSGALELGRVLASHGGGGLACQVCARTAADLAVPRGRTPCPGSPDAELPPTHAGNALALATAGLALLQAQRIVGGNGADHALGHEWVLDLTHGAIHVLSLRRSPDCPSGHVHWEPTQLDATADDTSFADLFAAAARALGTAEVALEPDRMALTVRVGCCGTTEAFLAPRSAPAPCPRCGRVAPPHADLRFPRVRESVARDLGVLERPLADLGLPRDGALVHARAAGRSAVHLLLRPSHAPEVSP